jgi:hypothetical protein
MQKTGLIILALLLPVAGFSEVNLKEDLWQQTGIELRKPLFKKELRVSQVRDGSLARGAGLLEGDALKEATLLGSCEGQPDKKISSGDKDGLAKALLEVSRVSDLDGKVCVLVSQMVVALERGDKRMFLLLTAGHKFNGIGVALRNLEGGQIVIDGLLMDGTAIMSGLKEGDLITMVDGAEVKSNSDVVKKIRAKEAGSIVDLVVVREGRKNRFRLPVTVMTQPPTAELLVSAEE